jgi:hypothetical protein
LDYFGAASFEQRWTVYNHLKSLKYAALRPQWKTPPAKIRERRL